MISMNGSFRSVMDSVSAITVPALYKPMVDTSSGTMTAYLAATGQTLKVPVVLVKCSSSATSDTVKPHAFHGITTDTRNTVSVDGNEESVEDETDNLLQQSPLVVEAEDQNEFDLLPDDYSFISVDAELER